MPILSSLWNHSECVLRLSLTLLAAFAFFSAGAVQSFPSDKEGWKGAVIDHPSKQWRVRSADGKDALYIRTFPEGRGLDDYLVVSNAEDCLVIDPTDAFARGAGSLMCSGWDFDSKPIEGGAAGVQVEWSGEPQYQVVDYIAGTTAEGHHWWKKKKVIPGARRRVYHHGFEIPVGLKRIGWRFDIARSGKRSPKGPVRLYSARIGTRDELGVDRPVNPPPRLLRNGEKMDISRGSVAFRYRRDKDAAGNETLFSLKSKHPGGGGPTLRWRRGEMSLDRNDLDNTSDVIMRPSPSFAGEWHHLIVAWDDSETRFYLDGHTWPRGKKKDSTSPMAVALADARLLEFDREGKELAEVVFGKNGAEIGGTAEGIRVWTSPLSDEAALAEYRKTLPVEIRTDEHYALEGRAKRIRVAARSPNGSSLDGMRPRLVDASGKTLAEGEPFSKKGGLSVIDAPALDVGEYKVIVGDAEEPYWVLSKGNPYSMPANGRPGVPGRMELLSTIRPDLAKLGPDEFRSVGGCRMSSLDGRPYLETGDNKFSRFALRLKLDPSAPLHCIEIDYPDDKERTADVMIQRVRDPNFRHIMDVGYMCGGREMKPSGKMLTHRCLYWTDSDDVALVCMTVRKGGPAAVAEVRVYKVVDGALPDAGIRDAKPVNGWGRHFGSFWEDPAIIEDFGADWGSAKSVSKILDRKAALMKYCGQDTFVYPGAWYFGLIAHDVYNPRYHSRHFLQAVYEKFDAEGLFVIPTVNQQSIPFDSGIVTRKTMSDGSLHDTAISIFDTGKPNWGGWHQTPPNFNILHPDTQAEFLRTVRALAREGTKHTSFKGICLHVPEHSCFTWGSISSGYNDYAVDAFSKETGVRVPGDRRDPLRGRVYAEFLKTKAYDRWVSWRCEKLTDLYVQAAGIIRRARPDARLFVCPWMQPDFKSPEYMKPGYPLRRIREAGIDPELLSRRIPGVIVGTVAVPSQWRNSLKESKLSEAAKKRYLELESSADAYELLEPADYGWVNLHDAYFESPIGRDAAGAGALSGDWFSEKRWRVTCINACGANSMRYYALALKFNDVMALSRGGYLIGVYGMEERMAKFARVFRALPAVRFEDVKSRNPNATIRSKTVDGRRYVYAVNTSPEPQRVSVGSSGVDIVTGESTDGVWTLEAYELRGMVAQ